MLELFHCSSSVSKVNEKICKMWMSLATRAVFLLTCLAVLPVHGQNAVATVFSGLGGTLGRLGNWLWEAWQAFKSVKSTFSFGTSDNDDYDRRRRYRDDERRRMDETMSKLESELRQAVETSMANMQKSVDALNDRVKLSLRNADAVLNELGASAEKSFAEVQRSIKELVLESRSTLEKTDVFLVEQAFLVELLITLVLLIIGLVCLHYCNADYLVGVFKYFVKCIGWVSLSSATGLFTATFVRFLWHLITGNKLSNQEVITIFQVLVQLVTIVTIAKMIFLWGQRRG